MPGFTSKRVNTVLIAVILGVAALLAGVYLGGLQQRQPAPADLKTATLYPEDFRPLADFELSTQQGQIFTRDNLRNRWSLVFFGYTYCPDVCPMTLTVLNQVKQRLGDIQPSHPVQYILVSVDPLRDSSKRLQEYLAFFNPEFIGVTDVSENQSELKKLGDSLGVFYSIPEKGTAENPATGKNYLVDHSAGIFLISPESKVFALFSAPHQPEAIAEDLKTIINLSS